MSRRENRSMNYFLLMTPEERNKCSVYLLGALMDKRKQPTKTPENCMTRIPFMRVEWTQSLGRLEKLMKRLGELTIIFILIFLPIISFGQRDFYIDYTLEEVKELHPDLTVSSDDMGTIAQFKIEDHITYTVVFDNSSDKSIALVLYVENKTSKYDERFIEGYSDVNLVKSHSNFYRIDETYILEYDILLVKIKPFNPVEEGTGKNLEN